MNSALRLLATTGLLAAGTLCAQTNTFPATGNVGIGTPTPTKTLDVNGPAVIRGGGLGAGAITQSGLYFYDDGSTNYLSARNSDGSRRNLVLDANFFQIALAGAERMRIDTAGNISIGTMAPLGKLNIAGDLNAGGSSWTGYYARANGAIATLRISDPASYGTTVGFVGTDTNTPFVIRANAQPVAWFVQSGNVGIGTAAPTYHLQVESTLDNQIQITGKGASFGGSLLANIYSERTTAAPITDRLLQVGSAYSPNTFGVFGSGNVGIGTTNPTNKLEVNGTIRTKEVIVETTGWSDYVFAPNYRLTPLSEVEAAIKASGHLPGIPSAADVAEHGVSLGDMQAKLLAKMEELTLHVISQEKRLDAQSALLGSQSAQLGAQSSRIAQLEAENAALRSQ